jgi:hypothetical protein
MLISLDQLLLIQQTFFFYFFTKLDILLKRSTVLRFSLQSVFHGISRVENLHHTLPCQLDFETHNCDIEYWQIQIRIRTGPSGDVFTTLCFLRNLQIGPNKLVLHYSVLTILVRHKHSSLFDPFINYEKNEVLRICTQGPYSQHFVSS